MNATFEKSCKFLAVPQEFIDFLAKNGITDADSFALMAAKEEDIPKEIFETAAASGCEVKVLSGKISIKKLWLACRKGLSASTSRPAGSDSNDSIAKETDLDIRAQWKQLHAIVLPDAWLLIAPLQAKLWRGVLCVSAVRGNASYGTIEAHDRYGPSVGYRPERDPRKSCRVMRSGRRRSSRPNGNIF